MVEVSTVLTALRDVVADTLKYNTLIVDGVPNTMDIGNVYIITPKSVDITHYISSGSIQNFEVEIVIPVQVYESDNVETLSRGIMGTYEEINRTLSQTFTRHKIIAGGNIYGAKYSQTQWESNGYIYNSADITVQFTSTIDL